MSDTAVQKQRKQKKKKKRREEHWETYRDGCTDDEAEGVKGDTFFGWRVKDRRWGEKSVCESRAGWGGLTYAHILIVQFCRGIAVVAQLA